MEGERSDLDPEGGQEAAQTQDTDDIYNIASNDAADGNIPMPTNGGHHGGDEFRECCPYGDNRQPNDEFTDP